MAALTFIPASAPIIPPLEVIDFEKRVALRSEIAAKIEGKVGNPADKNVPSLLLSIAALRVPPVETLFAVTLITASDPIVPWMKFEITTERVTRRG